MTTKKKILVVDDEPASLHLLKSLLSRSGYEVVEAVDGRDALRRIRSEKFDLVMSDILMPVMDGFELAQKIRTDPTLAQLPIVFYSATYHEKQALWLAEACGATERLDKPAPPQEILRAVETALHAPIQSLKLEPYLLAEEHARVLSEKVASKVQELRENQQRLEAEIERRKKTETLEQASEARYRSLVQGAPYGIYRSDEAGNLLMVNPALVAILNYETEADLLQANLERDIYAHPEDRHRLLCETKSIAVQSEQQWRRKNGNEITVRLIGRKLTEANGAAATYEVFVEDVTAQRVLEQQFLQAQKMEAIGRVAGGVAHDFNNLLMAISGYTDLLLTKLEPNTVVHNYAEQIKKAATRSAGLTRQLLAFSRQRVTASTVIDLKGLLTDLSSMLRHLLGPRIAVSIHTGSQPLYLEADPSQLEQIIVNLVVNARDAMPEGGSLRIEAFATHIVDVSRLPPGWYVCLSISDTGHGIEKHLQPKIFEPFFSTKGESGTGLGLATVYGIVKQAKGEVRVQSEPGQGATFTVLLPLSVKPATQPQMGTLPEAIYGSERILLVDDEEALRSSVKEYLEARGYSVLAARNGNEALEILDRENDVQLIVTDLMMPGLSGDDLARKVWEKNPGFAILFISGYMDSSAHEFVSARPAGMDYLEKPFPLAELAAKVRSLLDASRKCAPTELQDATGATFIN
jgi:two-component system cell cycle sensor histidine kinase/response regulator CckA